MPQFKRIGSERVAYGDAKFTGYSRRKVAQLKDYGVSEAYLIDGWRELMQAYESVAQDTEGYHMIYVSDSDLERLIEIEGMAHEFLTDPQFVGIDADSEEYRDLMPKRSKLVVLARMMDIDNGEDA